MQATRAFRRRSGPPDPSFRPAIGYWQPASGNSAAVVRAVAMGGYITFRCRLLRTWCCEPRPRSATPAPRSSSTTAVRRFERGPAFAGSSLDTCDVAGWVNRHCQEGESEAAARTSRSLAATRPASFRRRLAAALSSSRRPAKVATPLRGPLRPDRLGPAARPSAPSASTGTAPSTTCRARSPAVTAPMAARRAASAFAAPCAVHRDAVNKADRLRRDPARQEHCPPGAVWVTITTDRADPGHHLQCLPPSVIGPTRLPPRTVSAIFSVEVPP